nr:ATPase, F1/V1/A1 complex, alpha/beta subunit, zinc knuckle CX2CX4HX4C [Tanacetum cinerariifolium]
MNGMNENREDDIEGKKGCLDSGSNCMNDCTKSEDCVEVVNEGDDNSNNDCGKEFNDKDEEVVKKANVSNQNSGSKETNSSAGKSLADIVKSNMLDNKLIQVSTEVSEDGDNVVVFDDEIIELGSKKWNVDNLLDGDQEGIKEVINNGPWMVNNKPLVVQKWSIDMCMDKAEPKRIPVWVKMRNVLMEAWSVKGISALASSIGKPVIMDDITTRMCITGIGRIGFARVLVEIDAEKGIKDKIKIMHKSKSITEGTKKIVDVKYSWIPCICSHCKDFGHTDNGCKSKSKMGLMMVLIRNERRNVRGYNQWKTKNKFEYRKRKKDEEKGKGLNDNGGIDVGDYGFKTSNMQASGGSRNTKDNEKGSQKGSTSVDNNNRNGILGSNRFTLLNSLINGEDLIPNAEQRIIVDEFLSRKNEDNNVGMNGWTEEMKRYYRDRKKLFNASKEIEENEDVMEEECDEGSNVSRNEVEWVSLIRTLFDIFS